MEMSFMNQSGTSLATRRAIEPGVPLLRRRSVRKTRRQELEVKLATLQKDYAELHTAIFEAAQVHRRLCAPRLVRHGNFEIASEIFRSEEHTSELQSQSNLVCRLLLEKKKKKKK